MKKKLITMIGAIAMIVPMTITVANAEYTVDFDYDAVESTPNTAVYDVMAKGFVDIQNLEVQITLDASFMDIDTLKTTLSDCVTVQSGLPVKTSSVMGSASRGYFYRLQMQNDDSSRYTIKDTEPLLVVKLPITSNANHNITVKVSSTVGTITTKAESILPQTATVAGTTISEDANSEPATWFKVETTGVSGLTPYWYATVDGAAKKVAFTDANIEGPVSVGLVSTGSVSNAKVVWEVVEN